VRNPGTQHAGCWPQRPSCSCPSKICDTAQEEPSMLRHQQARQHSCECQGRAFQQCVTGLAALNSDKRSRKHIPIHGDKRPDNLRPCSSFTARHSKTVTLLQGAISVLSPADTSNIQVWHTSMFPMRSTAPSTLLSIPTDSKHLLSTCTQAVPVLQPQRSLLIVVTMHQRWGWPHRRCST
jgi:hypothetical protein